MDGSLPTEVPDIWNSPSRKHFGEGSTPSTKPMQRDQERLRGGEHPGQAYLAAQSWAEPSSVRDLDWSPDVDTQWLVWASMGDGYFDQACLTSWRSRSANTAWSVLSSARSAIHRTERLRARPQAAAFPAHTTWGRDVHDEPVIHQYESKLTSLEVDRSIHIRGTSPAAGWRSSRSHPA